MLPLSPVRVVTFGGDILTVPAIYVKYLSDKENLKEYFTDVLVPYLNGLGLASASKVLITGTSPKLIQLLAVAELGKSTIDLALDDPKLKKSLLDNDHGWFVENWPKISIAFDITTLSADVITSLAKRGDEVAEVLADSGKKEASEHVRKVSEEARKITGEALQVNRKLELVTKEAKRLINEASKEVNIVKSDLIHLASITEGEVQGLEYALKTEESLVRKMYDRTLSKDIEILGLENAISKTSLRMNDVMRFTITFNPNKYVDGYFEVLNTLKSKGYKKIEGVSYNAWFQGDGSYRGLNTTFETPSGQQFEFQFHTDETFKLKKSDNHELYEIARAADTPEAEKLLAQEQMKKSYETISLPRNIEKMSNE
ncbi:phage head morphogenesis protein, SPP1 gp7 family [Aquimarina agarilytica]|uniref:phage head morphogenesis protein, SPP1 gp7 family n=1 Tax=Aquimarina agarilytica TaxID=1087449 RepID=UPI000287D610|nr:phage head morphogenesis protein, SPP1 gp7 family [Aquimarina agarilytica]